MKVLAWYSIYNYNKQDSVYILSNGIRKYKISIINEGIFRYLKGKTFIDNNAKEHILEDINMFRVINTSFKNDVKLDINNNEYIPLNELKEMHIMTPLFLGNKL